MIKNIKNKYIRRAAWLVAIGPVTVVAVALGAGYGALDLGQQAGRAIITAAKQAW